MARSRYQGVSRLILAGDHPAEVGDHVVAELRSRERGGFIVLPKPLAQRRRASFERGEQVRVRDGALHDLVGLVEDMRSHERVAVLLELLGGQRRVELAATAIAKATNRLWLISSFAGKSDADRGEFEIAS